MYTLVMSIKDDQGSSAVSELDMVINSYEIRKFFHQSSNVPLNLLPFFELSKRVFENRT